MRDKREGTEVRERTEGDVPSCRGLGVGGLESSEGVITAEPRGCRKWGTAGLGGEGARKESAAPEMTEGERSRARGTGRGKVRSSGEMQDTEGP